MKIPCVLESCRARKTDIAKVKDAVLQNLIENAPKINPFAGIIRAVWHEYWCGGGHGNRR
jgi:hypothetical protein